MNNPTIVIVHKIKNRLRLKISHPLRNEKFAIEELLKRDCIEEVKYNSVIKSVTLKYDDYKITEEEIIMRFITIYSRDYDLIPVRLVYDSNIRKMPPMAYYSLATIALGGISKYLTIGENVRDFINWTAVATTIGAIGEHAYNEINEKGYFDPEVVSVMYLINSASKGKFLSPSAITWFTTFGRHLLDMSNNRLMITVREVVNKNSDNNEMYYDLTIIPDVDKSKRSSAVRMFLEKFIELEDNTMKKSFIVSNKGVSRNNGRFLSGFEGGPSLIVTGEKSSKNLNNVIN